MATSNQLDKNLTALLTDIADLTQARHDGAMAGTLKLPKKPIPLNRKDIAKACNSDDLAKGIATTISTDKSIPASILAQSQAALLAQIQKALLLYGRTFPEMLADQAVRHASIAGAGGPINGRFMTAMLRPLKPESEVKA